MVNLEGSQFWRYWFVYDGRNVVFYAHELKEAQKQYMEAFNIEFPPLLIKRESW